jgi:hypothetical protein
VAKWLTRWSAKPVFMGSNPIRCSNYINSLGRDSVTRADYCSGKCSECRAFSVFPACPAERNQSCDLVQLNAATKRNAMLSSSASKFCHLSAITRGVQSLTHAGGVRWRGFDSGRTNIRFAAQGVRCGLPTNREQTFGKFHKSGCRYSFELAATSFASQSNLRGETKQKNLKK